MPVPDWALICRMMAAEGRPFAWTGRAAVVAVPAVARLDGEAAAAVTVWVEEAGAMQAPLMKEL